MSNDELRKLIGGYATGNLTIEERRALYHAALDDQELFDALSDEQPLKELLDDEESRAEIERALRVESAPRPAAWIAGPWTWAAVGSLAAGIALISFFIGRPAPKPEQPTMIAASPELASPLEPPARAERFEKPAQLRERSKKPATPAAPPAPPMNAENGAATADSQSNAPRTNAVSQSAPMVAAEQKRAMAPAALAIAPFAYTILKRQPDGKLVALDPGEGLQVGDQLQFRVQPTGGGTLTIFERAPNGQWSAIADVQRAEPQKIYTLPPAPVRMAESMVLRLELANEERAKPASVEITLTPGRPPEVKQSRF
jgi:hypothetical protein